MTRRMTGHELTRTSRANRANALARNELRGPSEPRQAAQGVVSLAIKVVDPADRRLIDEELARRASTKGEVK